MLAPVAAPGEELCISYVDGLLPAAGRRDELRAKYAFSCACPRCREEHQQKEEEEEEEQEGGVAGWRRGGEAEQPGPGGKRGREEGEAPAEGLAEGSGAGGGGWRRPACRSWFLDHVCPGAGAEGGEGAEGALRALCRRVHDLMEQVRAADRPFRCC